MVFQLPQSIQRNPDVLVRYAQNNSKAKCLRGKNDSLGRGVGKESPMDMVFRFVVGSVSVMTVTWGVVIFVYEVVGWNIWSSVGAFLVTLFLIGLISRWFWSAYFPYDYDGNK